MGAAAKIVLDTNVLVSALGWAGPERRVYEMCLQGEIDLCICRHTVEDLLRVLDYPKFKFHEHHKVAFVQGLLRVANLVSPGPLPDVIRDDPDDNRVLACASNARAEFLITGDRHLLQLGSYGDTIICTASTFLASHGQSRRVPPR
ncbi:MAG: putative toxin-antitoxin system toxin component, PIN family [Firmicutes bacterium]|nr:putative toxin-antitoxin system toxin component, PIN family [Bacillota bacterium]